MALKKIDVKEKFPVMARPRLGAPPVAEDVLDNVGSDFPVPLPQVAEPAKPLPYQAKPRGSSGGDGRGVFKGVGRDARIGERTGRSFQFGARIRAEVADEIKRLADAQGMTIGALVEAMVESYKKQANTEA